VGVTCTVGVAMMLHPARPIGSDVSDMIQAMTHHLRQMMTSSCLERLLSQRPGRNHMACLIIVKTVFNL